MMKQVIFYILVLNIMLITGCADSNSQNQNQNQEQNQEQAQAQISSKQQAKVEILALPERALLDRNELPGDSELVMAAMINMIRGGDEVIPNIGFDPEGRHEALDDPFTYTGFDVKFVDIIYFKTENAQDNVRFALLEGGFYFADAIGRSAYVRFLAEYAVAKEDIIIANSEYEILPNPYPQVKAFIVPMDVVKNASPKVKNSFKGLFLMANQKAITMEPTQEEKTRYRQSQQRSNKKKKMSFMQKQKAFMKKFKHKRSAMPVEYCVMVFCMERLRPESRFILTVSKNGNASGSSLAKPLYLNDNGWLIGTAVGTFLVDDYQKEFFFNVQFNPGIDPENNKLKHISRFSSIKNYHSKRRFNTTGKTLLNPANVADAKLIQKKLADSGYYTMKIDGGFGKSSRRALKAFKLANGLGDNSQWNIQTQKALFK